jgi:hypothetical protein
VAHDAEAIYIVVRCYDSDMRGVRASQLRRDADLSSDDNVQLLIDSYDDRRSAFVFGTNPNGAMWDAQFSGVDELNENWNGVWDVAVSRDTGGWTAEFRIPLLALRFHAGTNSEFGFNIRRFIRRKNEEDLWRSYGRARGFYHLNNRPLSFGAFVNWGQFYGGHSTDLELTAAWRGGGHIIVSTDLTRTKAELPVGAFTAVVSASRLEYDFNTRTSLLAFVQYDNASERVDFNVRFHWIPVIGDDVFVVWNSGYTTEPLARFRFPDTRALARPLNGAFVVKVVHRLTP